MFTYLNNAVWSVRRVQYLRSNLALWFQIKFCIVELLTVLVFPLPRVALSTASMHQLKQCGHPSFLRFQYTFTRSAVMFNPIFIPEVMITHGFESIFHSYCVATSAEKPALTRLWNY